MTSRADGDLAVSGAPATITARRRDIADLPWTWLTQVHGPTVVVVDRPGGHAGAKADAAVAAVPDAVLAIHVADCAPVALVSGGGAVGLAHVGWRGLLAGVLPATVAAIRGLANPGDVTSVIGPCIHPECYEFGEDELDRVAAGSLGVASHPSPWNACTACSSDYWSHRARGDKQRQAMLVWLTEP
jgi:copper oxidase (laccase) domain-containing protein